MLSNASFFSLRILPKPTQEEDDENVEETKSIPAPIIATIIAPPYGQRKGWIPRNQEVILLFISLETFDVLYMLFVFSHAGLRRRRSVSGNYCIAVSLEYGSPEQ